MTRYRNTLRRLRKAPPILADYPEYVEPLRADPRFLAPPLVDDAGGRLLVRSWRYWYNARGIVEMENRLDGTATALIMVHPWGMDDGHGLRTPEPAGCADFCTVEKNRISHGHIREVVNPFHRRLRPHVALLGFSLIGSEDPIRRLLYPSIDVPPEAVDPAEGERRLRARLDAWRFGGEPLAAELDLDELAPLRRYFEQTPSTDAGPRYNGAGFWDLPMPLVAGLDRGPRDLVFYDADGYPKVRDFLKGRGIRHVLLTGYCTDMCVEKTTCGFETLARDFNVFLVGDATLATFPASTTPRFATQVALANAALRQMITQASWVRVARASPGRKGAGHRGHVEAR